VKVPARFGKVLKEFLIGKLLVLQISSFTRESFSANLKNWQKLRMSTFLTKLS
jgi:hypothetical protein